MSGSRHDFWKFMALAVALAVAARGAPLCAADAAQTVETTAWDAMPLANLGWRGVTDSQNTNSQTFGALEQDSSDAATPDESAGGAVSRSNSEEFPGTGLQGVLGHLAWLTVGLGVMAIVSLWLLKLWLTRRSGGPAAERSLSLIDSLRLGPRCGVYLVQVERQRVLVGIDSGKAMSLLALPASFADSLHEATDAAIDRTGASPIGPAEIPPGRLSERFTGLPEESLWFRGRRP